MARLSAHGIRLSSMSPSFLNSNSTSHTWPFSAVAELVDNATDPGVTAKKIWIDVVTENDQLCLTFTDNGSGMTPNKLHKMLSFGFTEKGSSKCSQQAIGIYGNGFKSGSMRLGRDTLVFTKNGGCQSVGMLSQTYLENIKAQAVIVPIVPFSQHTKSLVLTDDSEASLAAILQNSIITSVEQLQSHFDSITSKKGTKILIWNIRRAKDGEPEIDFATDVTDFHLPPIQMEEMRKRLKISGLLKVGQSIPEVHYSLRAYLSILYLKPRTQIVLRGKKVMAKLVSTRLKYIEHDIYKPHFSKDNVKITFGLSPDSAAHYGIMMYHNNRLIKSYEKVGCQLKASSQKVGIGVIGIIECNFLKPAHNKQDFEYTKEYRLTLSALGQKLNDYWKEVIMNNEPKKKLPALSEDEHDKDEFPMWLQCEECLKWRCVPTTYYNTDPENWTCSQNPNPRYRSCSAPEEAQDSMELSTPTYQKNLKRRDLPKAREQGKDYQEARHQIPSQSSSAPTSMSTCTPGHRRPGEECRTEADTLERDQENTRMNDDDDDDDAQTQAKPLVSTIVNNDRIEEQAFIKNKQKDDLETTSTATMEGEDADASSLKRKLVSSANCVEKKPRLQEEEEEESGKMADELKPDSRTNKTQMLPSGKSDLDASSQAENLSDTIQHVTLKLTRIHSLPSGQTMAVSPLRPCDLEEHGEKVNVRKLAKLEKKAQRLRQLLGLEITKTTESTMTTAHCSRDVGCQAGVAESSTSSCSLAQPDPHLLEKMPMKKIEATSKMVASNSEACEDSRSSQECLRDIRSNMVVLLTSLLPQLDLRDISLDTTDIDNILQQIIEVNALKL
ncbi:MORC family CW-type zinc finger protein 3 [Brachionichthys hirsutus]|uniref:MORC family CW-type zinc finger protein 3 n=1 Tax=Brachionichthys hirsutus TaxID=412623 RepID=UPI003604E897